MTQNLKKPRLSMFCFFNPLILVSLKYYEAIHCRNVTENCHLTQRLSAKPLVSRKYKGSEFSISLARNMMLSRKQIIAEGTGRFSHRYDQEGSKDWVNSYGI